VGAIALFDPLFACARLGMLQFVEFLLQLDIGLCHANRVARKPVSSIYSVR
jgi:hypothetical protein